MLDRVLEIQRQGVLGPHPKRADSLVFYSWGSVSETSQLPWEIVSVKAGTIFTDGCDQASRTVCKGALC